MGDQPHEKNPNHLTVDEIIKGCVVYANGDGEEIRECIVNNEMHQAFEFLKDFPKSVSFFGSARLPLDNKYAQMATSIAARVVKDLGYAVTTGGGPGIMGAANKGAFEADGKSLGLTIHLPQEQSTNPHVTDELAFHYFFTRKVSLTYAAEAYLFFPGGFGTMDEFFEILTLVQTEKIEPVPMILVGVEFWQPLVEYMQTTLRDKFKTISPEDVDLFVLTDDEDRIIEMIKEAPVRVGARIQEHEEFQLPQDS